jgi:hypothetical protein
MTLIINGIQHNDALNGTQHNDIKENIVRHKTHSIMTFSMLTLSKTILSKLA